MHLGFLQRVTVKAMTGATLFALASPLVHGQYPGYGPNPVQAQNPGYSQYPAYGQYPAYAPYPAQAQNQGYRQPPVPVQPTGYGQYPTNNQPQVNGQVVASSRPCAPCTVPCYTPPPCPKLEAIPPTAPPTAPTAPTAPTTPVQPTPAPAPATPTPPTQPETSAAAQEPTLPSEGGLALGGGTVAVADTAAGYIDSAIPRTRFRLRYDSAYGDNRPDRAEFFYPKCGCFANPALAGAAFDPKASGPPLPETKVDYQDIDGYLEAAVNDRLSGFIEIPYRFLNPEVNANTNGFSDLKVGFKAAAYASDSQYLTFQMRTYIPTGDGSRGLGTNHVSLEPGLLYYRKLSDRLSLEGEFKDWIPIGGSDFEGNVVRYGVGLSYLAMNSCKFRVSPVVEFVGWTVLSGKEADGATGAILNASGDTIINAKVGIRFGFGELIQPGGFGRSDLYIGYGRALTGDVWYRDLIRAEWRLNF